MTSINSKKCKIILFALLVGAVGGISFQKTLAQAVIPDYRSDQEIFISQIGYQVAEMEKLPSQIDSDQSLWTRVTGGIFSTTNNEVDEQFFYADQKLLELAGKIPQENLSVEQMETVSALLRRADEARIEYLKARQEAIDNGYNFQSSVGTTLENLYSMNRYQELVMANPEERDTTPPEGYDPEGRAQIAGEAAQENASELKEEESQCSIWNLFSWNCILALLSLIANVLLKLFGVLLWIASSIFDLSVYFSVVKFKDLIQIGTVDTIWRVMRDLANLTFIFILLYIAIGVIFDLQSVGSKAQRMIVNVIIIALLVNFSGFIVRVVVDASNVVAYEFYSRMSYDPQASEDWADSSWANPNLGTALISKLNLGSHVIPVEKATDALPASKTTRLGFMQIVLGAIGGVIIILMASFVLLAAAIMFMIRMVVLLLVYVLSPVALVCKLIPKMEGQYTKWKDALVKQSFYAPAFMIPLFGVFAILGENGLSTLVGSLGVGTGLMALTAVQLIVMGMIVSCIFIAQKFGAYGVGFAQKWSGKSNALLTRTGTRLIKGGGQLAWDKAGKKVTGKIASSSFVRDIATSKAGVAVGKVGSKVGSFVGPIAKDIGISAAETGIGKFVISKAKNPLITANDFVSGSATKAGVKDFNILGSSKESRAIEEEAKKKKELDKKIDDLKKATSAEAETILKGMGPKTIAKLPEKVLLRPEVGVKLSINALNAIYNEGLPDATLLGIKRNILSDSTAFGYNYMLTGKGNTEWP